jgi:hypothetical protein
MPTTEDTYPGSEFTSETIIRNTNELAIHNERAEEMFDAGTITRVHYFSILERNARHLIAWMNLPEEQREAFNNGPFGR